MKTKLLHKQIDKILDKNTSLIRRPDGYFECEIYADYRDEMSSETATEIITSENPMDVFNEKMFEFYGDEESRIEREVEEIVRNHLTASDGPYPEGLTSEESDEVEYYVRDSMSILYPEDHYLKQSFMVNIFVDTGDGNCDYSLNSVYPCWCGSHKQRPDNKASIVWLSKQQGYTKTELWNALIKGDISEPKGYLQSLRAELANLPSSMSQLVFLAKMTLEELIELNELIKLQDRNGRKYDATKRPYCGYITIDKKAETGLYDSWNGGGSLLEIQLEKDVRLPIRFIASAVPDGYDGYSIQKCYGACGSIWREDIVKKIHAPKTLGGEKL